MTREERGKSRKKLDPTRPHCAADRCISAMIAGPARPITARSAKLMAPSAERKDTRTEVGASVLVAFSDWIVLLIRLYTALKYLFCCLVGK